jgi:lysophospholipase L1-like esterase
MLGAGLYGTLATQARLARRAIGEPTEEPPGADGVYGERFAALAAPLSFVMAGDSSAAGLGVHRPVATPGALLAGGLAEAAQRPVRLTNVARSGARSADLEDQVSRALRARPDLAVIMIGANDVTHRVRPATSVRLLVEAVSRLRAADVQVVVGTCPDLGTIEPIAQPLRTLARFWSRNLAAAQTIAVVEAGGRSVSLGDLLGPEFAARPRDMFGPDRFHPSAAGYRAASMALLPSVCAAIGVAPVGEDLPEATRGEGLRSVAQAAVEASEIAGTEVSAHDTGGPERGPWGRWVLLRHRRRTQLPDEPDGDGVALVTHE